MLYQREEKVLAEVDAMEKGKDFGLAAQVSELQWRAEELGRGLRDLARLRAEASDAVVVVEGGALLEKREELEKELWMESSAVRVEVDVEGLMKVIAAVGKVKTDAVVNMVKKAKKWGGESELASERGCSSPFGFFFPICDPHPHTQRAFTCTSLYLYLSLLPFLPPPSLPSGVWRGVCAVSWP